MEFENYTPRRALGAGHWDRKLKERLTALSVADNYNDANREWIVTDNVWYIPFGDDALIELPDVHCEGNPLEAHPHECLCGHPIVWHFEIENTENGNKQIVGSEHIESYMVIRHFENKGVDPATVTEEMIDKWVSEKVKALKAEWWWNLHGEQFEEWFTAIRELDLRVNQRRKGNAYRWDGEVRRNTPVFVIRKRSEGKFGEVGYKMASIVWRWNHIDNTKKQIDTRGYPNERLWNDLQMFYIMAEQHKNRILQEDTQRVRRIEDIAERDKVAKVEAETRALAQIQLRAERRKMQEEKAVQEAELEGVNEQRRLDRIIADRINAENQNAKFVEMCEYYDLPVFTPALAEKEWDKRFLQNMVVEMSKGKSLSSRQLEFLRNIVVDEPLPASEKQIWYIKKLAGRDFEVPEGINRTEASNLIETLKAQGED